MNDNNINDWGGAIVVCGAGEVAACVGSLWRLGGPLLVLAGVLAFFAWLLFNCSRKSAVAAIGNNAPIAFDRRIQKLEARGFHERYVLALQGGLTWLAGIIDEDRRAEAERSPGPGWVAPPAWTGWSLMFTFGLSALYTSGFVFLSWLVTGAGRIGGMRLFDSDAPLALRLGVIAALFAALWLAANGSRNRRAGRTMSGSLKILLAGVIVIVIAGAGAGAGAFAGAGAVAVAGAFAFAGAFAGAGAAAAAVAFAAAAAVAVAVADSFLGVVSIAIPIAIPIAAALAVVIASQRYHKNLFIPWFYLLAIIIGACFALYFDGADEKLRLGEGRAATLIFLALLPAVNGAADWFSLGVSRALFNPLARGETGRLRTFFFSLFDIALAVFFLFFVTAFSLGAVAGAQKLHAMGGARQIIDVRAIVDSVRDAPFDLGNFWVYLMLGTTLVPTLVHLFAVLVALVGSVPVADRNALIALLREAREDSDQVGKASRQYAWFDAWPKIVVLIILALIFGFAAFFPALRDALVAGLALAGDWLLAFSYWLLDCVGV